MIDTPVPDIEERMRALDPGHSFIVQAPAGSGKTGLLIQRYLMLLNQVDSPEEVVAITFTRKAASEMRKRILSALDQVDRDPLNDHDRRTQELARSVLKRDLQEGWQITENSGRIRVQTIDSLCAGLTNQMPMLSRFGSQPETVEDAGELYLEASRSLIGLVESRDSLAEDVERVLDHLDNDVSRLERLMVDILSRRDHWLRHIHGRNRDDLESSLKITRRDAMERVLSLYGTHDSRELIEITRYAVANLSSSSRASPILGCDGMAQTPGSQESDLVRWCGLAELLLTGEGSWRKQIDIKIGFPPGTSKSEKEVSRLWKDRLTVMIGEMGGNDLLRQSLNQLRSLPPPSYTDSQWEVLGSITRLMPHAVAHLKIVFQSRGRVDFTEVSQAALMALGSPDEPTDLALALDYRIRHLLIDEFQDTSISQYELLSRLTAGWEEGDGRTLFVVGDPMQSIYRFREAEVGLFLRARENGIGNLSLRPVSLSANFRSQGGIVDWVNQTFSEVMPEREDISSGAVPYTPSTATHERLPGSAVHIHPFFDDDHFSEAERIVQIIRNLQSDEPESTTAILVRSRGHLREILIHLNEAGIRFRAIEIEGLGHRPVVQDLASLTRAIIHPADRMAWLAVMRAPWCGLTIADLHLIAADPSNPKLFVPPPTLWELINDEDILSRISADGRARLQRLRVVMGGCIANRYRSSLRSMVEGAWTLVGGPACVTDATDLADAKSYLDYLESNEETGSIPDLSLFERGLEKLFALPDLGAPENLQIMTIHKSKGLEFDHVIVPGLGRLSRNNEKKLFMWMEIPRSSDRQDLEGEGSDLLMAPIQETGLTGDPIYSWIEKLDSDKSHFEDQRLIYVASTRARRRLHLLGSAPLGRDQDGVVLKAPPRKSLLSKIWPVSSRYYEESISDPERVKKISSEETTSRGGLIDQSLRRLSSGWKLPTPPDPVEWAPPTEISSSQNKVEYSWAGEAARHAGSVVHRWLERIAEDRLEGWSVSRLDHLKDTFKQNLIECGVSGDDLEIAIGRVITSIKYSITDPRGRWLFGPQSEAQNELRLTGLIDGRRMDLVIDRTFLDKDGNRWIVDYKTSSHTGSDLEEFLDREQERYREQMDRYSAIMRRTDRRPVMIGLYFPLIGGWREWSGGHGHDVG